MKCISGYITPYSANYSPRSDGVRLKLLKFGLCNLLKVVFWLKYSKTLFLCFNSQHILIKESIFFLVGEKGKSRQPCEEGRGRFTVRLSGSA